MREKKLLWIRITMLFVTFIVLFGAIHVGSHKIRRDLELELQTILRDVAEQNVIAVEREIESKQTLLMAIAQNQRTFASSAEEVLNHLNAFVDVYQFKRMGFIYPDGTVCTTDGYVVDVSYRTYFQKGIEGKADVTDTMEEAIGDEKELINVFSVPVVGQDETTVEGVLFATYRTKRFQDLLNIDSFEGKGYSFIVKPNGDLITETKSDFLDDQSNIFKALNTASSDNSDIVEVMKRDMENGKRGSLKYWYGMDKYLYYVPLKIIDDAPWYIVTTVPESELAERMLPIIRTVNLLFVVMVVGAMASVLVYIYFGHRRKQELLRIAYIDSLTGGDNYACFQEKMKSRWNISGFLISLDISGFKIINNICGEEKGNEVICRIWSIIQKVIGPKNLAAHVNADVFVMFIEETKEDNLEVMLEEIMKKISTLSTELEVPRVVAVAGIYYGKIQGELEKCYGYANQAKHNLKERRDKNYAFYNELDFQQMMVVRAFEDGFDEALRENRFEIWYQPKYSVGSEKVAGAEALVRWRKQNGDLEQPGVFIPILEKNGMIPRLDDYVFRQVCEQVKEWELMGKEILPISVNISRTSLYYTDIVQRYLRILQTYGVKQKYIQLEVTESAVVENEEITDLIEQFKASGFKMLLDDFGNGYSSLASLNSMHFDVLKLDKSLIDYIGDTNGETLLQHVIRLAQSLGLSVTAEGVEHKEQLDFLKKLGCDDAQGYYFSKPLPLPAYEAVLAAK